MADQEPHALVVPAIWLGHVNACMLLARSLASLGFQVSFVYLTSQIEAHKERLVAHTHARRADTSFHQNHTFLHPSGSGSATGEGANARANSATIDGENDRGSLHIHVVEDGLAPGDIENPFFFAPAMKENLFNLILELQAQGTPVTCLISDPFAPWTTHVAERAGIPLITYSTTGALPFLLLDTSLLFSQGIFPEKGSPTRWKRETPLLLDHVPGLPPFSSELYPKDVRFGDASSPMVTFLQEAAWCGKRAERMLIHTISELEPDAFRALQAVGIPAYGIGPLVHQSKKEERSRASPQSNENLHQLGVSQAMKEIMDCIPWLTAQVESSVIYVAFGSRASITGEEIQELAFGLEASGNPFLWVIREDSHVGDELAQVLPNGFVDRIRGKGMVTSWAPQVEVLAHEAIGGFLTHCGWNSTLESLWEGVPMLCCPCMSDQLMNSHYVCEVWGVGLELARTETGAINRRYVEGGVRRLMQDEVGLKARGKAQELRELSRKTCEQGGQSFNNLQKFYEDMKDLCCKPSSK